MENITDRKLIKLLGGKDILFLEGDMTLNYSAGEFEKWLMKNEFKYNCLYGVRDLPMSYISKMVDWYDVIVYQTQWIHDEVHQIRDLIAKKTRKKIIIECIIGIEASYYIKPKGVIHDMYSLHSWQDQPSNEWELNKVKSR